MAKRFNVGDAVMHMNKEGVGEVTKITRDGTVHVTFTRELGNSTLTWRGEYDDLWFRTYPNGLRRVEPQPT